MEMEMWNVWATNRIPGAIGGLSTIIAIWVAARFASCLLYTSPSPRD